MFRNTSNTGLYSSSFLLVSTIIVLEEIKISYNWKLVTARVSFKIDIAVTCFDNQHVKITTGAWLMLVRGNWMDFNMNN